MDFPASVRPAVRCLQVITEGRGSWPQVEWEGFGGDWFHKVDPRPIQKVGTYTPTEDNGLERTVTVLKREVVFFFHHDQVAIVTVEGVMSHGKGGQTIWEVCAVRYAKFWHAPGIANVWIDRQLTTAFRASHPALRLADDFARTAPVS